jgi:hypothetical protein
VRKSFQTVSLGTSVNKQSFCHFMGKKCKNIGNSSGIYRDCLK